MKGTIRRLLSALMAAVLLAAIAPTALAASMGAYAHTNTKAYQSASTSSASVNVPKGTKVQISAVLGNWAQVKSSGITAYMNVGHLTLSNRVKGYAASGARLYEKASTSSDSAALSLNTTVYIVGRYNDFWRVQNANGSVTGYMKMDKVSNRKVSDPRDKVVAMEWFEGGNKVLARGEYGTVYDILSGQTIRIKRMGGTNHADIEPATAADTAKLLKACGGSFSWDSRPIILIAGGKYVACAMNAMPHGDQTLKNNSYPGHCCLHMVNSRTHGTNSVNESHQDAIVYAYKWAH